ncbi:MAG: FecR domain-containing protein [Thermodesulfobacteriota bacterium]
MKKKKTRGSALHTAAIPFLTALLVILTPRLSWAEAVGDFTVVKGDVDLLRAGEEASVPVEVGDDVSVGDIVRTKSLSRARVTFLDGSMMNIAERSRVEIKEFFFDPEKEVRRSVLRGFRGKVRSIVPKVFTGEESRFEVHTPTAVAAVRGTDFTAIIRTMPLVTVVINLEGLVAVRNINPDVPGEVILRAGQATTVALNEPPTPPRRLKKMEQRFLTSDHEIDWDITRVESLVEDFRPREGIGKGMAPRRERRIHRSMTEEGFVETEQIADVPVTETKPELLGTPVDITIEFP